MGAILKPRNLPRRQLLCGGSCSDPLPPGASPRGRPPPPHRHRATWQVRPRRAACATAPATAPAPPRLPAGRPEGAAGAGAAGRAAARRTDARAAGGSALPAGRGGGRRGTTGTERGERGCPAGRRAEPRRGAEAVRPGPGRAAAERAPLGKGLGRGRARGPRGSAWGSAGRPLPSLLALSLPLFRGGWRWRRRRRRQQRLPVVLLPGEGGYRRGRGGR